MNMAQHLQFPIISRILHWTMAVMVLAMLFIGIGMVASLSDYHWLVSIHKPLGVLILILDAIGGALSDRALWIAATAADPAALRCALRRAADDAHGSGVSAVRDIHCPLRGGVDARADLRGRRISKYGVLENLSRQPRIAKLTMSARYSIELADPPATASRSARSLCWLWSPYWHER